MVKVSVILPVYNGLPYLKSSIDSILSQSFRDFELIIVNDGSIDGSSNIVKSYNDPRIRFYEQENQGLVITLNKLVALSTGEYVARQDADDVSFFSRLEKQVEFLNANPDVAIVGTHAEIWETNTKTNRVHRHPVSDASIKFHLLFDNPFVHSSVMIRKSVFDDIGFYLEGQQKCFPEDYELWSRVSRKYHLANIPESLVAYREVDGSLSRVGENPFLPYVIKIGAENIVHMAGLKTDERSVALVMSELLHGVYNQRPSCTSLSNMRAILKTAALNILEFSNADANDLSTDVQEMQLLLTYHYWECRTGGLFAKLDYIGLVRLARKLCKRILITLSRLGH